MVKAVVICACQGLQDIDSEALRRSTGLDVHLATSALCAGHADDAAQIMAQPGRMICCRQARRDFEQGENGAEGARPLVLDLRDQAGWSDDPAPKSPKIAALIAESMIAAPPDKLIDVVSEGICLLLGPLELTLPAAEQLSDYLSVTVLAAPGQFDTDAYPENRSYDVVVGKLRNARGALGQFDLVIDAFQQVVPGGQRSLELSPARDGALSECDVIVDLRGSTPLFPAYEKREGYLRADPGHHASVAAAVLAASHLVGTFEKPLYVRTDPLLCAHSRAEQTGCTRCLDLCPTGAITPDGDHVTVDSMICAGCGACSAACPSGAISFDAPPVELIFRRVQIMAKAFCDAGGESPRLLVHDAHGAEMIRLSARHGRGLPANVVPMELGAIGAFGHAEMVAALAAGFGSVFLIPGPGADRMALQSQLDLANAIAGQHSHLLDTSDPDAMSEALYDASPQTRKFAPVRPIGTQRQITRQSARALNPGLERLPLPLGAPYGAVLVDTAACTLCLSCVSLCPSGALVDNPDLPQLRFQEDACLQCGLCANICPEDAITYEARLDLTDGALSARVLHEEEPCACVECGALFGVKSSVDRIVERLRNHAMFASESKLRMIQMCDNCRVKAQFHAQDNPFSTGETRKPRSTDDYFGARRDH